MTVADMPRFLFRVLEKLFPVQPHEWPKAFLLFSVATLWGMSTSISRAASEGLFLSHLGVEYLPALLLANPLLVLVLSMVYSAYADRLARDRLMIAAVVLPVPLIVLLRLVMLLHIPWVYFLLYAFVLAYGALLMLSWSVYLATHYDIQEAKRLIPFISSGLLLGAIVGGMVVVGGVALLGPANMLLLWAATLGAGALLVQRIARRYPFLEAPKARRGSGKPSLVRTIAEGFRYVRASALFMTMALTTLTTMIALQFIDFEYSTIFRATFPNGTALTAFLGMVDGLTTVLALLLQWFVVPWSLRHFGVQGTNLVYPYVLLVAFGGLASTSLLPSITLLAAIFARFTRMNLLPTLRGTPYALMLNAAPRKTGGLVRSFTTAMVLPLGQSVGALLLLLVKSLAMLWLLPVLGTVLTVVYIVCAHKQNRAYAAALLDLLREDRIHLLDLNDDDLRHLDASAVTAISARLMSDDEEVRLAAVALLRSIGSPPAYAVLREHLPSASPAVTAAALMALADSGSQDTMALVRPYLDAPHAQVRLAALAGLQRLDDSTLPQRAVAMMDDPDVQVQAAALALVLATPTGPAYTPAQRQWEAMLDATDTTTYIAALSVFPSVPETSLQGRLYRALDHADTAVRCAALQALLALAKAQRLSGVDAALLQILEADEVEVRYAALQVLTALGTDEALAHMLVLLDDEQPQIRETLTKSLTLFGQRAVAPLFERLRSSQISLLAKESALIALARLHGVDADALLTFWEAELHDVYQYKLMLTCLEDDAPLEADAFLRAALRNAHDQILSLLVQVLAVWTSPETARLVESGLHDTDRFKRASALEALESLSSHRFTHFLLPILAAEEGGHGDWRAVAYRQWQLTYPDVRTVIAACLQCPDKWIVMGALLAGHARAAVMGPTWSAILQDCASVPEDSDVRETAQRLLGMAATLGRWSLSLTDILLFLKRIPLYSSMHLEQLRTVAAHLVERAILPGEVIFREGEFSHELYVIVAGKVEIVQQRADGPLTLVTLAVGDFFGDIALVGDRPRSASAVAVEPTVLLTLSPEHFRQIVLEDPAMSFEIFRALSARIRRFDEAMQAVEDRQHETTRGA
jgi:CRP-like cAMP-binding protein/HEAT repeat protein